MNDNELSEFEQEVEEFFAVLDELSKTETDEFFKDLHWVLKKHRHRRDLYYMLASIHFLISAEKFGISEQAAGALGALVGSFSGLLDMPFE